MYNNYVLRKPIRKSRGAVDKTLVAYVINQSIKHYFSVRPKGDQPES